MAPPSSQAACLGCRRRSPRASATLGRGNEGDASRLFNLLPEGNASNYGSGTDLHAGKDMDERKAIFGALGDVYLAAEGGPGVAGEARAAVARGAAVLPLPRTGGASAGGFEFPAAALRRPEDLATEAQWAALTDAEASVEDAVAAAVDILGKMAAKVKPVEVKEEEAVKELESDAPADARPRLKPAAELSDYDCTLDVFLSGGGAFGCSVAKSLSHGGFQHLLSGVRATAAAKSGRYLFEVKALEKQAIDGAEPVLRVGLSLSGSSLLMGDGSAECCCFDQDGTFLCPTPEERWKSVRKATRMPLAQKVVGVLVNLDAASPNANTVSVFLDGVRAGAPQPLPAHLVGKALFPTVTFRNCTLAVNLGADGLRLKPLPFACRLFGDMAAADAEPTACTRPAQGKKYSVVLPVGLPQQGFFDYVDRFVEQHPGFVELSDRKIAEWCRRSGLKAQKWGAKPGQRSSRDRPALRYGVPAIDNRGAGKLLKTVAQFSKRNFILAEAKANLISKERQEAVKLFSSSPHFELVAKVAVGEPSGEHKEWVHRRILTMHEEKLQEIERRKRADAERAAKMQAKREAVKASRLARAGKKPGAAKEGADDEEAKADDGEAQEPAAKKARTEEGEAAAPPAPEVGPDVWYLKQPRDVPDVAESVLSSAFASFSLPTAEEGFGRVDFEWRPRAEAEAHLGSWTLKKRAEAVVEGIKPSEWFKAKLEAWTALKKEMRKKQAELKAKSKDGGLAKADEAKLHEELPDVSSTELHGSEDGASPPIYASFQREDWALLAARVELHLLAHAFVEDVEDSMYLGVPVDHVDHYFRVYFKTGFSAQAFACKDMKSVVELMADTLNILSSDHLSFLSSRCEKEQDFLNFARAVEEDRRDRMRRIEAGDESARLKFPAAVPEEGGKKGKGKGGEEAKGKGKAAAKAPLAIKASKWLQVARTGAAGKGKGKGGNTIPASRLAAAAPASTGWLRPAAGKAFSSGSAWEPKRPQAVAEERRQQPAKGRAKGGKNSATPAPPATLPWKPAAWRPAGGNASKGAKGASKGKAPTAWGSGAAPHRGNQGKSRKAGGAKGGKGTRGK